MWNIKNIQKWKIYKKTMKNVKLAELNKRTVNAFLNTQALKILQ